AFRAQPGASKSAASIHSRGRVDLLTRKRCPLKKHLIGFAALAALLAPVNAQAETNGVIDLSVGQMDIESTDLDTLAIGGSVAADLAGAWRAQFDVDATRISEGGDAMTFTNAAAHVFYDA